MDDPSQSQTQYYRHGRFHVEGGVLPDAITAFRTHGHPDNPCIIFPTCYGGKLDSQLHFIGKGRALDTTKYFVVTLALFSNGESSSPSNTPVPYNGPYFPEVSYQDNIRAQYVVLTKHLGIEKVKMVVGFSMGGQQAYHWAIMYPDFIEKYVVICGSARTSIHNQCFLEGPKAALIASKDFEGGHYRSIPQHGIRAFGRVYSAWAYGQAWFRKNEHLYSGTYPDLNSFLHEHWEVPFLQNWDANDLLVLLRTWQMGDVMQVHADPDLQTALGRIKAKGLIMPCKMDLYFPPEDNEIEVEHLNGNAKLVVIDSIWGHLAGGNANMLDVDFMQEQIKQFLAE